MPHFDGHEQHLVKCEENRDLQQYRQATGSRIDLFVTIELHHLLLQALLVIGEAVTQFLECGANSRIFAHRVI